MEGWRTNLFFRDQKERKKWIARGTRVGSVHKNKKLFFTAFQWNQFCTVYGVIFRVQRQFTKVCHCKASVSFRRLCQISSKVAGPPNAHLIPFTSLFHFVCLFGRGKGERKGKDMRDRERNWRQTWLWQELKFSVQWVQISLRAMQEVQAQRDFFMANILNRNRNFEFTFRLFLAMTLFSCSLADAVRTESLQIPNMIQTEVFARLSGPNKPCISHTDPSRNKIVAQRWSQRHVCQKKYAGHEFAGNLPSPSVKWPCTRWIMKAFLAN